MTPARLFMKSTNSLLIENLQVAEGFRDRGIGLMFRQSLKDNEGLLIHRCNWIHTFFMKFKIDCVFLDKQLRVCRVAHAVSPWKMVGPVIKARSVLEIAGGRAAQLQLKEGDDLYVGA